MLILVLIRWYDIMYIDFCFWMVMIGLKLLVKFRWERIFLWVLVCESKEKIWVDNVVVIFIFWLLFYWKNIFVVMESNWGCEVFRVGKLYENCYVDVYI